MNLLSGFTLPSGGVLNGGGTVAVRQFGLPGTLTIPPTGALRGGLRVLGSVVNAGTVAPGASPDIVTIVGNYTQLPGSTLEIEVGGLTPGVEHDLLVVTGTATLGGRLEVPLIDGYTPIAGKDEITFLTAAGGIFGSFDEIVAPNSDLTLELIRDPGITTRLGLIFSTSVFARQLTRGSMNGDSIIDGEDIGAFTLALRDPVAYEQQFFIEGSVLGDLDDNGRLDFDDIDEFAELIAESGAASSYQSAMAAIAGQLQVPEPSSNALASIMVVFSFILYRRRRSILIGPLQSGGMRLVGETL
jgi:hypothetical protein